MWECESRKCLTYNNRFIAVDYTRHTNLCRDFVLQCMFPHLCTILRLHVFVGSCFNLYTVCVCLSLYVCVVQCLLPMQSVRSSPQRVSAALKSLLQETQHATASPVTESCMIGGLQEVLQQFTRLSQNTKQVLYYSTCIYIHKYIVTQCDRVCRELWESCFLPVLLVIPICQLLFCSLIEKVRVRETLTYVLSPLFI